MNPDLDKYVKDYSGGMKRRLSLAIALVSNPDLLILDEPTVGIDPELRQQIWVELHNIAKEGKTILLTIHVMEDAEGTPDQLIIKDYQVKTVEDVFLKAGRQ